LRHRRARPQIKRQLQLIWHLAQYQLVDAGGLPVVDHCGYTIQRASLSTLNPAKRLTAGRWEIAYEVSNAKGGAVLGWFQTLTDGLNALNAVLAVTDRNVYGEPVTKRALQL